MTRIQRKENAEIKVKALERIMAKPLSYEESIYFGNKLAEADAKLRKAQLALLSPRQKRTNELFEAMRGRDSIY